MCQELEGTGPMPARSSQPEGLGADTEPVPHISSKCLLCTEPRAASLPPPASQQLLWAGPHCRHVTGVEAERLRNQVKVTQPKEQRLGSEPRQRDPRSEVLSSGPHGPLVDVCMVTTGKNLVSWSLI